jgi:hypothetical protein
MSSPFYVLATLLSLAGCGSAELFRAYPAVESPGVETAPWPRLAAGPTRAAALQDAPDPATGAAVASGLRAEAEAANAAAASLAGPVVEADALRAAAAAQRARAEAQAAAEQQSRAAAAPQAQH